jgi:hypothetical protein
MESGRAELLEELGSGSVLTERWKGPHRWNRHQSFGRAARAELGRRQC